MIYNLSQSLVVFPKRVLWIYLNNYALTKSDRKMINSFEMWCWCQMLCISWIMKRTNDSVLQEVQPKTVAAPEIFLCWGASRGQNMILRGQKSKNLPKMADFGNFFSSDWGESGGGGQSLWWGGSSTPCWCCHWPKTCFLCLIQNQMLS